jgi:hypothetical protein
MSPNAICKWLHAKLVLKIFLLEQRQEQETWTQKMLKRMPSTCPYGPEWKCVRGGYRCGADVTDEFNRDHMVDKRVVP